MFEECRLEGEFTLSSGRKSTFYYDFDLLSTEETASYVKLLVDQLPKEIVEQVDFIASPALGGVEIAFLVAFALKKPRVKIDKAGFVRGPEFENQRYLVVDDAVSSYQAVGRVRKALGNNRCIGVATFVYRGFPKDLPTKPPTFYLARKEPEFEERKDECYA